mgnify:FL=1
MSKLLIIFIIVFVLGFGVIIVVNNQKQTKMPAKESAVEVRKIEGYLGKVLAGNSSPFLEFNREDYEKALKSDKIILLDFYANWCPICRAEEPGILDGFDSLTTDKLIGFRINFNDSETDSDEKQLAKDFNVPYQHTKIFIKKGVEISRSVDQWDKERFLKEISNYSN